SPQLVTFRALSAASPGELAQPQPLAKATEPAGTTADAVSYQPACRIACAVLKKWIALRLRVLHTATRAARSRREWVALRLRVIPTAAKPPKASPKFRRRVPSCRGLCTFIA